MFDDVVVPADFVQAVRGASTWCLIDAFGSAHAHH
jgi:hypothetical protein